MKLIIAGGRDYHFTQDDYDRLDALHGAEIYVTEVVSGGATGADRCGEIWAKDQRIPIIQFMADWVQYGPRAGPVRNAKMAAHADAVALFPGGSGTASMRSEALKYGLMIFDFSNRMTVRINVSSPLATPDV
jgi:hypothetical protein